MGDGGQIGEEGSFSVMWSSAEHDQPLESLAASGFVRHCSGRGGTQQLPLPLCPISRCPFHPYPVPSSPGLCPLAPSMAPLPAAPHPSVVWLDFC